MAVPRSTKNPITVMTNKLIIKIGTLALIVSAIAIAPIRSSAAETDKPAVKPEKTEAPKEKTIPFRGTLVSLDKVKMTMTVSSRTFEITSETKITKDDKPAIFSDGVVGDSVGGAYKTSADGKLIATTVNLTTKATEKPAPKAKDKAPEKPAM